MTLLRPTVLLPLLFARLVAAFSFWLERRVNLLTQSPPVEPAGEIDLVSGELAVDVYSDTGLPMHHIEADHAIHYLAGDRTALERPRVTSLREDVRFTGRAQRADVFDHGERIEAFGDVLVRVSPRYRLEFHIDTDEANAAGLKDGDIGEILL